MIKNIIMLLFFILWIFFIVMLQKRNSFITKLIVILTGFILFSTYFITDVLGTTLSKFTSSIPGYITGIILFVIWVYLLSVLKRTKLDFFRFLLGSVGMFMFGLFYLSNTLIVPFSYIVTSISGFFGKLTGAFTIFSNYGILAVNGNESVNLYIDFECSGILEILTYVSMVMFFPAYKTYEKLIIQVFGTIYILAANILRLCFIGGMVYSFGMDNYFLYHSIIARFIFLIFIIGLYFYTFSRKQIMNQKVGNFNYG